MATPRPRIIHPMPGMVQRVSSAHEVEFAWPRLERVAIVDMAYTLPTGLWLAAFTALTAARTLTLPPASTMDAGTPLVVKDESGSAASHTITVAAQGSDTVDGAASLTITTNYGALRLYTDGAGHWFSA